MVWDLQLGVHWCPQESRCQPLETENWANNYPLVNIQKNIQKKHQKIACSESWSDLPIYQKNRSDVMILNGQRWPEATSKGPIMERCCRDDVRLWNPNKAQVQTNICLATKIRRPPGGGLSLVCAMTTSYIYIYINYIYYLPCHSWPKTSPERLA